MKMGIIGLGKMGAAIAHRAVAAGHTVWGYDPSESGRSAGTQAGAQVVDSLQEMTHHADVIWLMVPVQVVEILLQELVPHLKQESIVIDGGNSKFTDSMARAQQLARQNVDFLDVGTSGGVHGLMNGFSLMVGGDVHVYERVLPLLQAIAAPEGVAHVGPSGAGHYVKMVHNGIEYGLMQAYAEGLRLLKEGSFKDVHLDLETITRVWQHGSVIRSFLLELTHKILVNDEQLQEVSGIVEQTGMGKWTYEDACAHNLPMPALEAALRVREESLKTGGNYATKLLALMRHAFGGHAVDRVKR